MYPKSNLVLSLLDLKEENSRKDRERSLVDQEEFKTKSSELKRIQTHMHVITNRVMESFEKINRIL